MKSRRTRPEAAQGRQTIRTPGAFGWTAEHQAGATRPGLRIHGGHSGPRWPQRPRSHWVLLGRGRVPHDESGARHRGSQGPGLVAAALDTADCRPRLANSSAEPAYSGTSWIRPLMSAGSTSSRLPTIVTIAWKAISCQRSPGTPASSPALREVERPDTDHATVPSSPARTGEGDQAAPAGTHAGTYRQMSTTTRQLGMWSAVSACRNAPVPAEPAAAYRGSWRSICRAWPHSGVDDAQVADRPTPGLSLCSRR